MSKKYQYSAMATGLFIPGILCRARQNYRAQPHSLAAGAVVRFLGEESLPVDKGRSRRLFHFLDEAGRELASTIQVSPGLFERLLPAVPEGASPRVADCFADLWHASADTRALACIRLGELGKESECVLDEIENIALYDSGYSRDHAVIVRVAAERALHAIGLPDS